MSTADQAPTEIYLGDGLYCKWHGYAIQLRAPREGADHECWLEPYMLIVMIAYLAPYLSDQTLRGIRASLPIQGNP